MKLPLLLFIQATIAISSPGQRISISSPVHLARWPYENLYKFEVKDVPCSRIVVKADQGEISQYGCELTYQPDSLGYTVFRFYRKTSYGLHLIDTVLIGVRVNELVYPTLGDQTGGQISRANVLAIGGVLLEEFVNDSHAITIHLISYKIIVIHGDSTWSIRNVGIKFCPEALALLQALQPHDKLIITDIEASDSKRTSIPVRPAEFTIR